MNLKNTDPSRGVLAPYWQALKDNEPDSGYVPYLLWQFPIHYRSRAKFREDNRDEILKELNFRFKQLEAVYGTRDQFDASDFVSHVWRRLTKPWWGYADIIGWFDVRISPFDLESTVTLFLVKGRLSRRLTTKTFAHRDSVKIGLAMTTTTETLKHSVIEAIQDIAERNKLAKFHLDFDRIQRIVKYTDVAGIFSEYLEDLKAGKTW